MQKTDSVVNENIYCSLDQEGDPTCRVKKNCVHTEVVSFPLGVEEGARSADEGLSIKQFLFNNPPTWLRRTSSTRGAVTAALCAKQWTRAFTLVELLVVVLIIGILSAIAVPQYKKAVTKSHLSTLKALVTPVSKAAETYRLINNHYPHQFDELDVQLPTPQRTELTYESWAKQGSTTHVYYYPWGLCRLSNHEWGSSTQYYITCRNEKVHIQYSRYLPGTNAYPACAACVAMDNNPTALAVCKEETHTTTPSIGTNTFSYSVCS